MKRRIIKFLIDKAKRNKLIQSVFEQPLDLSRLPIMGTFTDSLGNEHPLYNGLRSKLKPGWQQVFQQKPYQAVYTPKKIANNVRNGRVAVNRIEPIVNLYCPGLKKSRVLEIGCSIGSTSYAFAERGAQVTGTEFSGFKVSSTDDKEVKDHDLNEVNEDLKKLRALVRDEFKVDSSSITFADDDICNSRLKPNSYDIICSWDVLEHLHNPLNAFKNMYKLLSDNGIAVHEYNPFFSLIGGHSASTIDFPWGHVVLSESDFERYSKKVQPKRFERAMSFYKNGLNRMTIKDFEMYCSEANLEILAYITFPKEQHLRMMNKEILISAKKNYPSVELNDLISTKIIAVMKKKH